MSDLRVQAAAGLPGCQAVGAQALGSQRSAKLQAVDF